MPHHIILFSSSFFFILFNMCMSIFVDKEDGSRHHVEIGADAKVCDLMDAVGAETGYVLYEGKVLGNEEQVAETGIGQEDIVHIHGEREAAKKELERDGVLVSPRGFLESAGKGKLRALKLLLICGIAPGAVTGFGNTALIVAAGQGQAEVVEHLLALSPPIDVNAVNTLHETALLEAVRGNQLPIASLLLSRSADATISDIDGTTPLHAAVCQNSTKMARLLLSSQPDPSCIIRLATSDNFLTEFATPKMLKVFKEF
eukprot:TRINITY_DN10374_c3_g1_i1.p1 TRINITY_DN10374_c3_g1~~TRINITY_DN10374_c3_g1_i1.p1  ORF type:complete len:265 (+),score=43.20 TRINITY_DN10374_c3_g1_i1:23-796(+)